MTASTPEQILACIEDKFVNVGWDQGRSITRHPDTNEPVGYCLLGAAASCSGYAPIEHRFIPDAVTKAIYKRLPEQFKAPLDTALTQFWMRDCIVDFNDANETTKDQVLDVIRAALKDVRDAA